MFRWMQTLCLHQWKIPYLGWWCKNENKNHFECVAEYWYIPFQILKILWKFHTSSWIPKSFIKNFNFNPITYNNSSLLLIPSDTMPREMWPTPILVILTLTMANLKEIPHCGNYPITSCPVRENENKSSRYY